ncbi:MAG TPA: hypothetical protein VE344_05530 [Methylomirabilota bacterium]|nr:hypothetical protein [Methylomirabilota bacterium]
MKFFKFTTDKITKRLRWVMVCVILFDKFNTLLGQPNTYWQHPETVDEINRGVHYFLSKGLPIYLLDSLITISLLFLFVSIISRKIALIVIFTVILNHYFGASFWLCYHWNFGIGGPLIYGIILSTIIVLLVFPTPDKTSSEKSFPNKPDA